MRVAAGQLATSMDRAANRSAAVAAVRQAAGQGAELVVLPEATMCAFGPGDPDLSPYAEPLAGDFVSALRQVAEETGTTIVAGTFEPAGVPHHVYNTVVVVDGAGLVAAYRKFHLFDALGWKESDRIVAGDPGRDQAVVFPLGGLVVGVMNCYDLRFPEMARTLVDRGATALVVPANWIGGPGKAETWEILLRARAIENTAYVVAAAKPEPECAGHSMVVDPTGLVLTALGGGGQGWATAELRPERVSEVRATVPVLGNRRFDVSPRP